MKQNEKMTIHRALSELKLIDSKITKGIEAIEPTGIYQKDKLVNGIITKKDFIKKAKGKFQSVQDLIARKNKIKSAIVKINGITMVEVSEIEMTIADAITFKTVIELKKLLILNITDKNKKVLGKFKTENETINAVALNNAKIMLGRQDDGNVKPTDEDVKAITDPFIKRNEYHLLDPLNCTKLIDELQEEVEQFDSEVDAVLSEINAITEINF